ncbi:MAG: YciI family protein [Candidatus Eremiobacteraeota bacterium]|nr:YciI family protein [Candidatus Eremiobacteraeota bacterium]
MRFTMFMIPGKRAEQGILPDPEFFVEMNRYNEELQKAGVLLDLDGLHPTSKGARVTFHAGRRPTVTDGPFTEAKEVIGGYWMIQVKSKEEAIEWATRCPAADGETIEVRQVFEMEDFSPEIQAAVAERQGRIEEGLRKQQGS